MADTTIRLYQGRISFQVNRKTLRTLMIATFIFLTIFVISLCSGSSTYHIFDVLNTLWSPETSPHNFVIYQLRLPRTLVAIMAGAALAVSGLILQKVIRNTLASPDIIGVTSGASVGAVLFISTLTGSLSADWLPTVAIIGAGLTAILIYVLAWNQGITPLRFVLIGIGLAAALNAIATMIIVLSPNAARMQAYIWLTGSVYGSSWIEVSNMLPWMIFLPCSLVFSSQIQALDLGDATATSLGVSVQKYRLVLLAISSVLAGCAVAFAGGIGFVGLIAPHITKKLVQGSFISSAILSALIGAMLVMAADWIGRVSFLPQDLPAGIFISGIGAPFFIYLLYRNRH